MTAKASSLIFHVTFGYCFVNNCVRSTMSGKPVSKYPCMVTGFVPQLAAKLASSGTGAADAAELPIIGVPVTAAPVVVVTAMTAAITPARADERLQGTDRRLVNWSRTFNIWSSSLSAVQMPLQPVTRTSASIAGKEALGLCAELPLLVC